jgi:hypothetical protein
MLLKVRIALLTAPLLAMCAGARADVFVFQDLTDTVSLTLNGNPVRGNGGRITNFTTGGELISFDLTAMGVAQVAGSGFTNLVDQGPEDTKGTVSDRFVVTFGKPPFATYHVSFGSDPDLPAIPSGAIDLTTSRIQGLPPNPYFEDGKQDLVGTSLKANGVKVDQFFIVSDVNGVPETSTWMMLLVGFVGLGLAGYRRAWRSAVAA